MQRGRSGRMVTTSSVAGEPVRAFLPHPLPPDPPLSIDAELRSTLDAALLALGRLDSVTTLLPDTRLFLYTYIRKEAVLSSQIEGTQSSLSDLLAYEAGEAPGVPLDDVVEVSNYVAALEHGLSRLREGFPLSNRLLREIHALLLRDGRGAEKNPGEFRRSQNGIGGTRPGNALFVPPPPEYVAECMGALERWLHDEPERTPTLLKAALAHVQFETIHPFLDGNGRVGRLLMTLLLCAEGVLAEPLLYLSLYLKQHRAEYYDLLGRVRTDGDWEAWVSFIAEGVRQTAPGAVTTAQRLVRLFQGDRGRIREIGRAAGSALRVHAALQERPLASASGLATRTGLSVPAVNATLVTLQEIGVVREVTGRRRNRLFSYEAYLGILNEGTERL
jgi:Fic family protein